MANPQRDDTARPQRDRSASPGMKLRSAVPKPAPKKAVEVKPPHALPSVDVGTAALSMGYYQLRPGEDPHRVNVENIGSVTHYEFDQLPHDGQGRNASYDPVLLYYPPSHDGNPVKPICGFEVQELLKNPRNEIHQHMDRVVHHVKLILDDSDYAEQTRKQVQSKLMALILDGTISSMDDALFHVLCHALNHAYDYLVRSQRQIKKNATIEFVVSMPVAWSPQSCNRLLLAFNKAIRAEWPNAGDAMPTKFTVAEPLAAAEFIIAEEHNSRSVKVHENVMIMDAGGGTVETITCKVTRAKPLRFEQITQPSASSCGSSLLNQGMLNMVMPKIQRNLDKNCGRSVRTVAESRVLAGFENITKRTTRFRLDTTFQVPELSGPDKEIVVTTEEMAEVFQPCLDGISALVDDQFRKCQANDIDVDIFLMAGSFSDNEHVRFAVNNVIDRYSPNTRVVNLKYPAGVAVATGAVLRALNRSHGPGTFLTVSFGILRHIPKTWTDDEDVEWDETHDYASLKGRKAQIGNDGYPCFLNQAAWFAYKGDKVKPGQRFEFYSRHNFDGKDGSWALDEKIHFAAERKKNFYHIDDPENLDAVHLGTLALEFNELKSRDDIPTEVQEDGSVVYQLTFKVVVTMSEQFFHVLHFAAHWAPGLAEDDHAAFVKDPDAMEVEHETLVDIGAAFELSTV